MTIITKGMGAIMKAAMKKAGFPKPTFPGQRSTELLNKRLKKNKARASDRKEGALKIRNSKTTGKQIPSASAIEIDARINRKFYKDFNPGQK